MMTTGAVTLPEYNSNNFWGKRTDDIAKSDHVMGALIVELDKDLFHVRQVQSAKDGSFVDLGKRYHASGKVSKEVAEALIIGDIHAGDTDDEVFDSNLALAELVKPKRFILHDVFNGHSVNHHNKNKAIRRVIRYNENKHELADEFLLVDTYLQKLDGKAPEIIILKCNHDDWIDQYLEAGDWCKREPHNTVVCASLIEPFVKGELPLEVGIRRITKVSKSKMIFLRREDDYIVDGVQLGVHGDIGSSGSRGSLENISNGVGSAIIGHGHTPGIFRKTYSVGTCTKLRLSYNKGSSTWLHTSAVLYSGGSVQLINFFGKKWRLEN